MRPSFQPRLVNTALEDPGLFVPFLFERRALLFDLGALGPLTARDLLKISHIFVTHTHIDHFIGFDTLLRVSLGRDKEVHLFGPPDFFRQVEGKLAGYTWNLVGDERYPLVLRVFEVHSDRVMSRSYPCRERFRPEPTEELPFTGILLEEPAFRVEAALLDHGIPCLCFSLKENFYVNIKKEALKEMGLPVGPWLTRFKRALYEKRDMGEEFLVTWEQGGKIVKEEAFILGELSENIAKISPGQKIAYITDIIGTPENYAKALTLARDADHLFIEAAFLDRDREMARTKCHLTAREAGELARLAGAKAMTVFHFSPRYVDREEEIRKEAEAAFRGGV
ncbi:MAG: ribonuclease Z [Proteobacteria bacterium]|nr:ribonuclease Z [Pseudomonadota bacterium]